MDRRIFILSLGNFAIGTGMYVFLGVLGAIAADLDVSVSAAGQMGTAFALTFAVAAPILVPATRGLGSRRTLLVALGGFGLVNVVGALAPSFGVLLGSRVVGGAFACLYAPVAGAVATTMVPPDKRGKALAAVVAGIVLALAIGVPVGTVVAGAVGWRATFALAAVASALGFVAIRVAIPANQTAPARAARSFGFLRQWSAAGNLLLVLIAFTGVFLTVGYIGPLLKALTGLDEAGIGALQVLVGFGGAVGTGVGGTLADTHATRRTVATVFTVGALAYVPFSALFVLSEPGATLTIAGAGAALFLGSASVFALVPLLQVRIVREAPNEADTALAIYFAVFYFAQGLGAAVGGVVVGLTSLTHLGGTSTALLVGGAAVTMLFVRDR